MRTLTQYMPPQSLPVPSENTRTGATAKRSPEVVLRLSIASTWDREQLFDGQAFPAASPASVKRLRRAVGRMSQHPDPKYKLCRTLTGPPLSQLQQIEIVWLYIVKSIDLQLLIRVALAQSCGHINTGELVADRSQCVA